MLFYLVVSISMRPKSESGGCINSLAGCVDCLGDIKPPKSKGEINDSALESPRTLSDVFQHCLMLCVMFNAIIHV